MYNHVSERSGQEAPLIADDVYEIIMKVFSVFIFEFGFYVYIYHRLYEAFSL